MSRTHTAAGKHLRGRGIAVRVERHRDLPRDELVAYAERLMLAYARVGRQATIHFKVTCPACGSRQTFDEENTWHDQLICEACGATSPVSSGGFLLILGGWKAK